MIILRRRLEFINAWSQKSAAYETTSASQDMDAAASRKIVITILREPASSPRPADDCGVNEWLLEKGEDNLLRELSPFGHTTWNHSCGGYRERNLKHE